MIKCQFSFTIIISKRYIHWNKNVTYIKSTLKQIYNLRWVLFRWVSETAKIKNRNAQFNYPDVPRDGRAGSRSNTKSNEITSMQESATNLCSSSSDNNLGGYSRVAFSYWVTKKDRRFLRYSRPTTVLFNFSRFPLFSMPFRVLMPLSTKI